MSSLKDRLAAMMPKRAPVEPDPAHVTVPASLVRAAKAASWMAFFALVYFLWLYTLDIAKDRAASLHLTQAGTWSGDINFWFPYIVGFAAVAVGIPYVAKIAIPVFMSLTWRENFWPKMWALFIAMAVSLVVIAGTFTVQGDAIVEKGRDAVVAEQARTDAIATLERQKANAQAELEAMTSTAMGSRFQAQAARAGVDGWQVTIDQAKRGGDPMLPQIERALGSAKSADIIRQRIRDLDDKIGAAPQAAAVAERVETRATGWIQATLDWLEGARAILLSLVMDVVCLLMPWIAQRLEQARNRQLAGIPDSIVQPQGAPWADEAHMVADLREEAAPKARGMAPAREEVFDAETGEKLVRIKPREYYRRAGGKRKGEPVPMDMGPANPAPDDKPVLGEHDARVARSVGESEDEQRNTLSEDAGDTSLGGGGVEEEHGGDGSSNDGRNDDALDEAGYDPERSAGDAGAGATASDYLAALGMTPAAQVYDAPIGPEQPKGLGKRGDEGVMVAAE